MINRKIYLAVEIPPAPSPARATQ